MSIQFNNANQAAEFLKQVAAQSYGSGMLEGTKGGAGSIGMIDGKPVKFNTHWWERAGSSTSDAMIRSSNELREALGAAAKKICDCGDCSTEWLSGIRKDLGLDASGSAAANRTLLSRQTAAQVLHAIDAMRNDFVEDGDVRQSSFADVANRARSSKGVDTTFAAREQEARVAREQKVRVAREQEARVENMRECVTGLGIPTDKTTLEGLVRSMQSPHQCFFRRNRDEKIQHLLEALKTGKFRAEDTNVKVTVEFLNRLPQAKRADGLALALAVGPVDDLLDLVSERVIDDLRALQGTGPITSETVKRWTDQKISQFTDHYPYAPGLGLSEDFTTNRLFMARKLDLLMLVDELDKADLLKTNDPDMSINLGAWREGPRPEGARESVLSRVEQHAVFGTLGTLANSFDEVRLINDFGPGPNDIVLSKAAIPAGTLAMNPKYLNKELDPLISGDLKRTQIKATFVCNDGKTVSLDTGDGPALCREGKGNFSLKTTEIRESVNVFLGLERNAPETPQSRVVSSMFSQFSMGVTQGIVPNGEHLRRNLTFTREGGDVLVRVTNLNRDDVCSFDFTVRIRPDGSNCYESFSLLTNGLHKDPTPINQAALCLVRAWGNLPPSDHKKICDAFGPSFSSQFQKAKKLVERSPTFMKFFDLKVPTADQLAAFSQAHTDALVEKMNRDLPKVNHTGLAPEFIRCFHGTNADRTSVQGEFIDSKTPMTDENCLTLPPGETWGYDPTQYDANKAALEKIMALIPPDNPNRKALTLLMTMNMGLQGSFGQMAVTPEKLGFLSHNDMLSKTDVGVEMIVTNSIQAGGAPHQDLSVDGNDLVLTQRFSYSPLFLEIDGLEDVCDLREIINSSMPTITFVTEIRAPLNQNLKPGEIPKFTCTTRVLNV